jgi:hypothetical protein
LSKKLVSIFVLFALNVDKIEINGKN